MAASKQVNAAGRATRSSRRPKLGQNFLIDAGAARRIVEALGEVNQSVVIEIGPGRGALTKALAERAKRLIAVEFDPMLARQLGVAFSERENVEIVHGNFLDVSIPELLKSSPAGDRRRAKVVGNIPYYITSDILLRLFEQHEWLETVVMMVQKEVADRLAGDPGSRDYGLLTVTARLFSEVERLFTLPPDAFSPPPQVHSSVLRLRIAPRAAALGVDERKFLDFCKLAFAQKRKTLFNNLRSRYGEERTREALNANRVRPDVRAEALSLEQLAGTYHRLAQIVD